MAVLHNLRIVFAEDPQLSTGVINGGMSKRFPFDSGVWDYLTGAPGAQLILWLEGSRGLVLPAGSLAVSTVFGNGGIILFARARFIRTASPKTAVISGMLTSLGFGFDIRCTGKGDYFSY